MIPYHLLSPVRDVGAHFGQPLQGAKDLFTLTILGRIDDLRHLRQIGQPLVGEGSPDDIADQFFHGCPLLGKWALAAFFIDK